MSLGEVFVPGVPSDVSYTGDTGDSQLSVSYWRDKVREFQSTLNAVDVIAQSSQIVADNVPESSERDAVLAGLDEFAWKRTTFKATAEALNLGAAAINAAGGRFPVLSIPRSLGLAPFVMPVAAVAALTTAAALVAWASAWADVQVARIEEARKTIALIEDPAARDAAAIAAAGAASSAAQAAAATDSPLASIATIVKVAGIGILGFLAWRAFAARH